MSKKPITPSPEDEQRQSRKEVLLARKQSQQMRQVRLGIMVVAGLVLLVFLVAMINELFIAPNRTIATFNGDTITLHDWQNRVAYERAQRIIFLENQLEAFSGDVGIIQQFAGQAISEMAPQNAENLGQDVLNRMVDELVIQQAAEVRGIAVTDADVQKRIEEDFAYFNGESPTPLPSATGTIMPTPSLTPIPTAVITDVLPTATPFPTPTTGPTATPRPTATPVSLESFQTNFGDLLERFVALGVEEATYRSVIKAQLYRERLMDALATEQNLSTNAEHASVYLLTYITEESANEGKALIDAGDYLTIWNTVRSSPFDPEAESTASASEILWRTQTDLESSIGADAAAEAFTLPLNTPSGVLSNQINEETVRYYVLMVSGREERPLNESAINQNKQQALTNFIDSQLAGNLQLTEAWRGRVPSRPVLDPLYFAPPTEAPPTATIPVVINTPAPVATEDGS